MPPPEPPEMKLTPLFPPLALMAPGIYEFRAETQDPDGSEALGIYLSAPVESVAFGNPDGSLTLQIGGVGEVDFSDVRGIR